MQKLSSNLEKVNDITKHDIYFEQKKETLYIMFYSKKKKNVYFR